MYLGAVICVVALIFRSVTAKPEYMGCYLYPERPISADIKYVTIDLTPEICIDYCRVRSYYYAELNLRIYCFCKNEAPLESTKEYEDDCWLSCLGDGSKKCGGLMRKSVYKTGYERVAQTDPTTTEVLEPSVTSPKVTTETPIECVRSVTTVNGEPTCSGDVIFEESFDTLSSTKWKHDIKIPRVPDYLYVVYDAKPDNSYISNGKLVIKPTLLPTDQVNRGTLELKGCTGDDNENECGYTAKYYFVLPPVQSTRLTTNGSFSFRYGKVEITAKLPLGDWLVPEIWLEPKKYVYGAENNTWRIRMAMSRGNRDLKTDQYDSIGCTLLENFATVGFGNKLKKLTAKKEHKDGWYKDYHNYTLFWRPGNIVFSVDGEVLGPLTDENGFSADTYKLSPFDSEHYISLGLYAGGSTDFPDDSMNNGGEQKPWNNTDPKAMAKFWSHSNSWKATWNDDLALLQVDHIKVTAL